MKKTKQTKDRKQNRSKQDLTTIGVKQYKIQCSPVLAEVGGGGGGVTLGVLEPPNFCP